MNDPVPPPAGNRAELIRLVERATRAPSSHNTQPWNFEIDRGELLLHADRTRALPVNDPDDRELTISCGAALFNLRAAAAADGRRVDVELLPDDHRPDLLARVRIDSGPGGDEGSLAMAIDERRTWRKRFSDRRIETTLISSLARATAREGAWLQVIEQGEQRRHLAGLVSEGDRIQFSDPDWRRELAGWMRLRRKGDGMSLFGVATPAVKPVVRAFDLGKSTAKKDRKLVDEAPLLAVLRTEGDSAKDRLRAGQALQRALLTAAGEGVQAAYLNQPCQVAGLRLRLKELLAQPGDPQVVMCLGYPDGNIGPGTRRPVDEVLTGIRG